MLGVGCVFLVAECLTGLLMATELARPGVGFLGTSRYLELLSDHGAAATTLSLWPLALGLALTRVRLHPSAWLVVAAGAASILAGGALEFAASHEIEIAGFGWTSYAPNPSPNSTEHLIHQYALGTGLGLVGVVLATAPLAPAVRRGTPFAAAAVGAALALPFPMITWFRAAAGSSWETPQHVTFLALALTLLGATAEALGRVPRLYFVSVATFVPVAGVVSIAHAAGTPIGDGNREDAVLGAPVACTLATLLFAFAVSRRRRSAPGLFAAAALLQLVAAGALGTILAASDPLQHRGDTQLVNAHLHFALLGFGLCALLALAHARWPQLDERAAVAGLGLLVAGTAVLSVAEVVAGNRRMPRRVSDYAPMFGDENLAAAIGGGLAALAVLVLAGNAFAAARASRFPNPRLRS